MIQEKTLMIPDGVCEKKATIYTDTDIRPKACILYFHGGGLLYGTRTDLPELHRNTLTKAGYLIAAFDYPLAPAAKLDTIVSDVCASVNHFLENTRLYTEGTAFSEDGKETAGVLPYFLWGRSAGAYLCLLAAAGGKLKKTPAGLLSYYGYGFLCDGWFMTPSRYYCSLPSVPESVLNAISQEIHTDGDLATHYGVYVYARQTGRWLDMIYEGRQKFFYLDYTLRTCEKFPCPLFCAHSTGDTDVPYAEFLELCGRFRAQRFVASRDMHDFDRDEADPVTARLLEATVKFLNLKAEL